MIVLNTTTSFSSAKPAKNEGNQDAILSLEKRGQGWLMAVADGVGSYDGASTMSHFIISSLSKHQALSHDYFKNGLLADIKDDLLKKYPKDSKIERAATTLSACYLNSEGLSVWHVGDCRVYLREHNKLIQITNDHTQYQKLLDMGIYSKRELAELNVNKHQLTTAIAKWIEIVPEVTFIPMDDLREECGAKLDIIIMSDGAHHFWDLRKRFTESTMVDMVKYSNALKRRIERAEPIDDYSLVSASFDISQVNFM